MDQPDNGSEALIQLLSLRARNSLDTPPGVFLTLEKAARKHGVSILRNGRGRACGYVAYAQLNKESFALFRSRGMLPHNSWEWDEGNFVIIADCMWKNLKFAECRRQLREAIGRARVIGYIRDGEVKIWSLRNKIFRLVEPEAYAAGRPTCNQD